MFNFFLIIFIILLFIDKNIIIKKILKIKNFYLNF